MYHSLEDWAGLNQIEDYLSYLEYLLWVFTPLAIVFILPFLIVILLYLSILFLYVYKVHKHILPFLFLLSRYQMYHLQRMWNFLHTNMERILEIFVRLRTSIV